MSAPSNGGYAFPVATFFTPNGDVAHTGHYWDGNGMTLRAWLCGHAPQIPHGWLEHEMIGGVRREVGQPERHARWRAAYADAQIALLEGKPLA